MVKIDASTAGFTPEPGGVVMRHCSKDQGSAGGIGGAVAEFLGGRP